MSSGLLFNPHIKWIAFNSAFDFAYMLKLLTSTDLPLSECEFLSTLQSCIPVFYDVKHMRNDESDLNSQLKTEKIVRVGVAHQAGSDSLVTLKLFHKSLNDPLYRG